MCHRTLRGKEWCTKNQEMGEQAVRLAGPPLGHIVTGLPSGNLDCVLECTYMRIPSVTRMGFFCFFLINVHPCDNQPYVGKLQVEDKLV